MIDQSRYRATILSAGMCFVVLLASRVFGQLPPVISTVFPAGGRAGQSVEIAVSGSNLQGLRTLHCNVVGVRCEQLEPTRFRLTIPENSPLGLHDVWAVGDNGVSAPRTFVIGNRAERLELEPNQTELDAMSVPLDVVINGQLDKVGDTDHFRFEAKQGQRVVVECWAERIDSRLRAVLEIFDATGRRLDVNRGYFGIDPLIDFRVPADGSYVVKVHDLVSMGSAEHYYRLDIDTGPRVAFSVPSVIRRGKASRVALYGWNFVGSVDRATTPDDHAALDRVEVDIPESLAQAVWPLPVRMQPAQAVLAGNSFPYHFPGSHAPVVIGLSDVPVVLDRDDNHSPVSAQEIVVPCEVSGRLVVGDERDWFAIQARRGEVLFMEGLGERIDSPIDLQISVHDASAQREFAQFGDETRNIGGTFPTGHLDPAGRWVCPADGRYLIAIRNLIGGLQTNPRRTYRLSVRREVPDFQLVVVPRRDDPAGLNLQRGGREVLDLLAFRRRGLDGPIRVSAKDLPDGVACPEVWLGPGVDRAVVVVSADRNAAAVFGELKLDGVAEEAAAPNHRSARGGTVVWAGTPNGSGRLTSQIPLAVAGDAPLRITADGHETLDHHLYGKLPARHSPGGVVDVAIQIERRDTDHQAPVKLIGAGLAESIQNQTAIIPAGQQKGYLSFYLPPTLPVGHYSLAVRAETTVPTLDKKTETVAVFSNVVTLDVQPAAFLVEADPFAVTRAKRGEVIQIGYSAKRLNGFIGKMHTELAAPGRVTDVVGLRGRGETFVGQTDKGSLQIIVNEDAPIGRQQFLRLFTVGVVEDEPVFFGSRFLTLEIVE
ncbi:MAG: PPC domain-containing protein [Planctomycetota bacterium]|nr:PPC domain-containing protein [Planctomycetota bacterium]